MTALAMLIGMLPMSLGLGEGGEQNAPLGRAVIGGLTLATAYTLFFVPLMYSAAAHADADARGDRVSDAATPLDSAVPARRTATRARANPRWLALASVLPLAARRWAWFRASARASSCRTPPRRCAGSRPLRRRHQAAAGARIRS